MPEIANPRRIFLLLFCLLSGLVWAQPEFFFLRGLQFHSSGSGEGGPDWISLERYSYFSDPLEPLRISFVRWQSDLWADPDSDYHYDNTFAFLGLVNYASDEVLIRSPGYDHTNGNGYRVSRISNSGYYLEDRYTENPWAAFAQIQINYFYNDDMLLVRKIRRVNWPLEYWKHEYSLDARGRRLLETVSSSVDSLNWTPRHSYAYVYGNQAVPDGYQFEKYSSYVPWRYSSETTELPPFPYLNDSQVVSSIIHREFVGGVWSEPDTFALNLTFSATGASVDYRNGIFTWTSEGLPKSVELPPDANPYLGVNFTFDHSASSAASEPLLPAVPSPRVSPNPVQDKAWVNLGIIPKGPVRLLIFNLRGQLLREEIHPNLAQGENKLELPLMNAHCERLPNGLYFLRMESRESSETCRFLVLR
ncbi:MAG TPA: T9SS type A sorting domain-containing protein [Candidatus Syntrophosphaera sp.]|nr:T9SS type A sorting domain-containing protein [Candidatus Syntrophosphaera sp.]